MQVPNLGLVLLFVANPQNSSLFYQDLFEMKPIEESPTFAMFAFTNGVMLGLWSKYTAEPRVEAQAGALEVCFPVDDVDALYEAWGKKRVTIAQKPVDMDFGRTFVALDLDGHRIRIYKLAEEHS
ncbi:MAG: glyoxalase/bleomycin resistance protein/dioxygenase [Chlamydiia bacterium]|nr:glyoxalase/bleomycin resistance protein/dioxygenase [Chlamydiia bacterium]